MYSNTNDTLALITETNQVADTFVQQSLTEAVTLRLLSFRCQEAQTQGMPGQDYARLVTDRYGSSLCFCVCDGVGSSYKGGFAAHYLAVCLVNWLRTLTTIPRKPSDLSLTLQTYLDQWVYTAQVELNREGISSEVPELVREVLRDLQNQHGSQTVFLCGRIERVRSSFPLSRSYRTRAIFCWMGNVTARIFPTPTRHIEIGDRGNDHNRWSTVQGCHGKVRTRIFTFNTIDRLIVHTDGLDTIGRDLASLDNTELQKRIQHLLLLPTNDDMTLLDLQWLSSAVKKGKIES